MKMNRKCWKRTERRIRVRGWKGADCGLQVMLDETVGENVRMALPCQIVEEALVNVLQQLPWTEMTSDTPLVHLDDPLRTKFASVT